MKLTWVMSAAIVLSGAAHAEPPKSEKDKTQVSKPETDNDPMICKKEKVLGSRLTSKKSCMLKSQWAALRAEARQDVEKMQANRWKSN